MPPTSSPEKSQNDDLTSLRRQVTEFETAQRDLIQRLQQAERALQRAEQKYQNLFTYTVVGVFEATPEAEYLNANPRLANLYGYVSPEQLIAALNNPKQQRYINPEHQAEFVRLLQAQEEISKFESAVYRKDGQVIWISQSAYPVKDENGQLLYYQCFVEDITECKQAKQALHQSNAKNRAMLKAIPDLILEIGRDGTYLNCHATENFGLLVPPEQSLGKKVSEVLPPDIAQDRMQGIELAFQTGETQVYEDRLFKQGSVHYEESRIAVLSDEKALVIVRDITERKLTEEALRQSEQRFRLALDNFPDMFVIYDAQKRIQFVNTEAVRRSGRSEANLLGRTDEELFPAETIDAYLPTLQRAIETRARQTAECRLSLPTADPLDLLVTYIPLLDAQGDILQILGITQDVTERKQVEANRLAQERAVQLEMQMTELQRLHQLKDDFLNTVSHELRTPMANITMAIKMLDISLKQAGVLVEGETEPVASPSRLAHYLQILQRECQREISLINDLLDLQRLEAGVHALKSERLRLQVWLPAQLQRFEERVNSNQQTLRLELLPNLPDLACDRTSLERVVSELLHNACKYTPPGESIWVKAWATSGWLQLQVSNEGIEIPKTELQRIFERFYRIPEADRWQQGGTGLGLALVQKLVELMGGRVWAESRAGSTLFTLALPCGEAR